MCRQGIGMGRVSLLFLLVGASSAAWTQYTGSASRNATQGLLGKSTAGMKVAWTVSPPFGSQNSFFGGPMIDEARGHVVIAGNDGYLYSFTMNNGTKVFRTCIGKHGTFPSSPCTGYRFPSGRVDDNMQSNYWYPVLTIDGSIIVVVALDDTPAEPPYGYNDRRATVVRVNATNGAVLWAVTTGLFNPANADSASITRPVIHPSGDILFWQRTNGEAHFCRMDYRTGKTLFNVTGSKGFNFTHVDELTYIEDDDSVWTNAQQDGGLVKLSAKNGELLAHFKDIILGSMSLPNPGMYDQRTKWIHFGKIGTNDAFALDAITGEPVWHIPADEAGWPSSSVLCPKNRVVWFSDNAILEAWDAQSAENQKPVWQVLADDPPPPARQLAASEDGFIVVSYASGLWLINCTAGDIVWKQSFSGSGSSAVNPGPALGDNEIYWNAGGVLTKLVPQ